MSTPALKPLPSLRNTTTRVSRCLPAAVMVSASSNQPATVNAFTGGTSMTTSAMPWSSRTQLIPTAEEPTGDLTPRQIRAPLRFGVADPRISRVHHAKSVLERGDVEVGGRFAAAMDGE